MATSKYDKFFEGRTVLVTGGAGFIGTHLTQQLLTLGCNVKIIDDLSSSSGDSINQNNVDFTYGSILDNNAVQKAIVGCSHIFHLAAMVSVPESVTNPKKCFETNVEGTANLLRAAKLHKCEKFIFASSAACYGQNPTLPSKEADAVAPVSPYAESKYSAEELVKSAGAEIDRVSLRFFNIFGSGQDAGASYAAVISAFIKAKALGRPPILFGNGEQSRDFTHVSNAVHAMLLAASHKNILNGEVFNVGTGTAITLIELVNIIFGSNQATISKPSRAGDVMHSCASIARIKKTLGYHVIQNTPEAIVKLCINPKQPSYCSHLSFERK